jgi:hypothetical protein
MSTFVTVLVAAGTAVVVTAAGELTVKPGLAARAKRLQTRNDYRDRFEETVNMLLITCRMLQKPTPAGITDEHRQQVEVERERWLRQVDEHTTWLVDNQLQVAVGFFQFPVLGQLAARYAVACREQWLAQAPLDERLRVLNELSNICIPAFFGSRFQNPKRRGLLLRQLEARLIELHGGTAGSVAEG